MAADEQLRAQAARTIDRNVATFTFRLRLPKDQTLLGNAVFGHREAQMAIDAEHRRVRMTSDRQLSAAATTAASVATGFLAQGKCRQCAREPALADTVAAAGRKSVVEGKHDEIRENTGSRRTLKKK